ncbi:MAG: YafY family transcriptional regulator [Oscillospiraceae bacterium]|jgi:predicted DNA-binding transcriptional regulator YafY|nr:YafY family transcriptional regulator [Oscillospiraceae bacterium]
MKIDRLIGITMYLLNRDVVSAGELAERFEVSVRTVSRDIETLNMAGIPVISSTGSGGGYAVTDAFSLNKQIANIDDYFFVVSALQTLCSAYENKKLDATLEKLLAVRRGKSPGKSDERRVFVDFGVVKEGENIPEYTRLLEKAIAGETAVSFDYTSAEGAVTHRIAEPLALNYRWYAWYLLAFCSTKNDYRIFKLNRMSSLTDTGLPFSRRHENIAELLDEQWSRDDRERLTVRMLCKPEARAGVMEYFHAAIEEELENGDFICTFSAINSERLWFSLLMSFGGQVRVLEPASLIERVKRTAKEIFSRYEN